MTEPLQLQYQLAMNPMHVYCRMIKAGIDHDNAVKGSKEVERLLQPFLYPKDRVNELLNRGVNNEQHFGD